MSASSIALCGTERALDLPVEALEVRLVESVVCLLLHSCLLGNPVRQVRGRLELLCVVRLLHARGGVDHGLDRLVDHHSGITLVVAVDGRE